MTYNLPKKIPIFPLRGVIFFPETNLPLNIFENRYLTMVNKILKDNKYLGMVQSKKIGGEIYQVGCLGKIDEYSRTEDGRIVINLKGINRFQIDKEIKNNEPYREFFVKYDLFKDDSDIKEIKVKNERLNELINNSKVIPARLQGLDSEGRLIQFLLLEYVNQGFEWHVLTPNANAEHYNLFKNYQEDRHSDGEMAAMTFSDFRSMIEDTSVETYLIEFRNSQGVLLAGCLVDQISDAYSAVYSYFSPTENNRSLGNFIILWLVERTKALGLSYVYLGYWIKDCPKMSYKSRYNQIEYLGPSGWEKFHNNCLN